MPSINLNGIKDRIEALLEAANTVGASPVDLSNGLLNSTRVQNVLTVNPLMIEPQASLFPLVTCFVSGKSIELKTIAATQLLGTRRSRVTISIVGSVWNDTIRTFDEDPADTDINTLMENVELILRSDPTFNGLVNWQFPTEVKYYTDVLDEQTHLRSGLLSLECDVYY